MLDNKGYTIAAWICVALVAAGMVWEIVQGDWSGVLLLGAFLTGAVVFILQRSRLPSLFSFLFALAALINGAGWVFDFYKVPGFDPFSHAFTSFAAALAVGFLTLHSTAVHFREHGWAYAVAIAAFGLAVGGLWEIFEWAIGVDQTYQAVAMDLIMDSLGSILAGMLAAWVIHTQPAEQLKA